MPRATILPILTLAAALELAVVAAPYAQDRYGPSAPTPASAAVMAPVPDTGPVQASAPRRSRFLSWPGKDGATKSAAPVAMAQAPAVARTDHASALAKPAYMDGAAPTRASARWTPVQAAAPVHPAVAVQAPSQSPSLAGAPQPVPTSIYAQGPARPAAAPTAPGRTASAQNGSGQASPIQTPPRHVAAAPGQGDERVRFYSVHRQYGLQPDPAPIPPQFFTATADMSEPPGPIPIQRLTTGSGSSTTTRTLRGADGSDASSGQQ